MSNQRPTTGGAGGKSARDRSLSKGAQQSFQVLAGALPQNQTEALQLRKQLIQEKANRQDLEEQVAEQRRLYLNSIKERDENREKLKALQGNVQRIDEIVQHKVTLAISDKERELKELKLTCSQQKQKLALLDSQLQQVNFEKKQLRDENVSLNNDLAALQRGGDAKNYLSTVETLRREKQDSTKKHEELLAEINQLSNQMEDCIAENRVLRQMANVPDNYGIKRDEIKLYDKEKIEDFKKLIKVLQEDNYKLEKERANLKHSMKLQSMMYKEPESGERYAGLSKEQIYDVDMYVLKLKNGSAETEQPGDYYKLKKENETLKAALDALNTKGFEVISNKITQVFKNKSMGENSGQIQQLVDDNSQLRGMIQQLIERSHVVSDRLPQAPYSAAESGTGPSQAKHAGYQRFGGFRPPLPHHGIDGEITSGTSYKFNNTQLKVVDKEGRSGASSSSLHEQAFLQLQLQECLELVQRKDSALQNQHSVIQSLYEKIRKYLLTQDQLYKDFVRLERNFTKKEQDLRAENRKALDQVAEEKTKTSKLEKALETSTSESIKAKMIELTKQNSILEVNLMRLSRKYQCLEEQEKLLRREYHNKDAEMGEKDRFTQQRINQLKEWKAKALHQLDTLYSKLKLAVPVSELQQSTMQLDVIKQKNNDLAMQGAKQAKLISDLQRRLRGNMEAEETVRQFQEQCADCEEELEVIKKRLEQFDPAFRFENQVFQKISSIINRVKASPKQAFEQFDRNKTGQLSKQEFKDALKDLRVFDLSQQEFQTVWNAVDIDRSGSIDYKEFVRKLSRYGVKNRSREEQIICQMVEALEHSQVNGLSELFQIMDKSGSGYVSRDDFNDIFTSLNLKIDRRELERFMDNFWRDKDAGIDYQGFLRIFSRYQNRIAREQRASSVRAPITENVLRLKKRAYEEIESAVSSSGRTLRDVFRRVDADQGGSIDSKELYQMFMDMGIRVSAADSHEIFKSADVDMDGRVSLPEFVADFNNTVAKPIESLIRDEKSASEADTLKQIDAQSLTATDGGVSLQRKVDMLREREKQLIRKVDTFMRIKQDAEESLAVLQKNFDGLERDWEEQQRSNYQMKDQLIALQSEMKGMIRKDDAVGLQSTNERLLTELTETRAAMLSYKNMCSVIGEQARGIKLALGRRRDEHDGLLMAMREMQSENIDRERLGKLYFVVMLSRWQEAAVNKKYDLVLNEAKELRGELLNTQQYASVFEDKAHAQENKHAEQLLEVEKLRQQLNQGKSTSVMAKNRTEELTAIIQNISEAKTDLEEAHIKLRIEYRDDKDKLDSALAKADMSQQLMQQLSNEKDSDLSRRLIDLSKTIQEIRLNEYQARRQASELEERAKYLSNLLKGKNDAVASLEKKASECEAELVKEREQFRQRENERTAQFFYNRSDNLFQPKEPSKNSVSPAKRGAQLDSGLLSKKSIPKPDSANQRFSNRTTGANIDTSAYVDKIKALQTQVDDLKANVSQRDAALQRFEQWQLSDKYLNKDEMLKDAIDEHRVKTMQASDLEAKEMADAAYQTIKTLQDMLDAKNEAMHRKEDQIEKMRAQMRQGRELDAKVIAELREQQSLAGNSTLSKLHEIVRKNDVTGKPASGAAPGQWERLGQQEMQRQLQDKDQRIRELTAQMQGSKGKMDHFSQKRQAQDHQIAHLEEQLRKERLKQDQMSTERKRFERLQKERLEQDKTISVLQKAIDGLKDKMVRLETEKERVSQSAKRETLKEGAEIAMVKKEMAAMKTKVGIATQSRDKAQEELLLLKVRETDLNNQLAQAKKQGAASEDVLPLKKENQRLEFDVKRLEQDVKRLKLSGGAQVPEPLPSQKAEACQHLHAISEHELEQLYQPIVGASWSANSARGLGTILSQCLQTAKILIVDKVRDQLGNNTFVRELSSLDSAQTMSGQIGKSEFVDTVKRQVHLQLSAKTLEDIQFGRIFMDQQQQSALKSASQKASGKRDQSPADLLPSKDKTCGVPARAGKQSQCREVARQVLIAIPQISDVLTAQDSLAEGLLECKTISKTIKAQSQGEVDQEQLEVLIKQADKATRGFLVIQTFVQLLQDLAKETDQEALARRFAKTIGHQAINLRAELSNFDNLRSGKLEKQVFKRAVKQLAIAMSDSEMEQLFELGVLAGGMNAPVQQLEIKEFCSQISQASRQKPPPQLLNIQSKPASKVISRGITSAQKNVSGGQNSAFENWEVEKKYKKSLEALKQEIEDRNREIQLVRQEVKDSKDRAQRLEQEKQSLEKRIVERHDRPPGQMKSESQAVNSLEEIQRLRDEIFHVQSVNQALTKTIQVDLKAELGRLTSEKEQLETKLRVSQEKLRAKTSEFNALIGKPMDELVRREEGEEAKQKLIDQLRQENEEQDNQKSRLNEELFKAQERILDLKFEKETFDLCYARLQKRISDLEHYKLQSSQLSAVLKNEHEVEIAEIQNETAKLRGDALASKPGETVKLRKQSNKTAAELEAVVEQLKRVIDKQRIEIERLSKLKEQLEAQVTKKSNEPKLRQRVEQLERQVHSYEMQEVNVDEKDVTIRKLVFANKTLRDDLQREIDRFTLLESKFKQVLMKANIEHRDLEKQQRAMFTLQTGAQMDRYSDFLNEPKSHHQSKLTEEPKDDADLGAIEAGYASDDSLNGINKREARYLS